MVVVLAAATPESGEFDIIAGMASGTTHFTDDVLA